MVEFIETPAQQLGGVPPRLSIGRVAHHQQTATAEQGSGDRHQHLRCTKAAGRHHIRWSRQRGSESGGVGLGHHHMVGNPQRTHRVAEQICSLGPTFDQKQRYIPTASSDHKPRETTTRAEIDHRQRAVRQRANEVVGVMNGVVEIDRADGAASLDLAEETTKVVVRHSRGR